jgi:hypothetical protein
MKINMKSFKNIGIQIIINLYSSADRLRDKSGKTGEGFCASAAVPDLQRLARTNADKYPAADSP